MENIIKKTRLSIVIPVYNVEKYVDKCLISCIQQNIPREDYEIIVINDGSTDDSFSLLQKYKESNVRIYTQSNKGLSATRNIGIMYAKGEYLWFIDSDDYIEDGCLEKIMPLLNLQVDILHLSYRLVYEDSNKEKQIFFPFYKGKKTGVYSFTRDLYSTAAQLSIYKKSFLLQNSLKFVEGIFHEDCDFKPKAVYLASTCYSSNFICYNYLQRKKGSITSDVEIKNITDILTVNDSLLKFIADRDISGRVKHSFYRRIGLNYNMALNLLKKMNVDERKKAEKELLAHRKSIQSLIKSLKIKYVFEGCLLFLLPQLVIQLYLKLSR